MKKYTVGDLVYIGAPWVAGASVFLVMWVGHFAERTFDEKSSSAFYGGVLMYSGLLVSVLMGLIGALLSLDARPILQAIRRRGMYEELVQLAWKPLMGFLLASPFALVALFIRPADPVVLKRLLGSLMGAILVFGLVATFRFAKQLVAVMAFRDSSDSDETKAASAAPAVARPTGHGRPVVMPPGAKLSSL